MRASACCSWAVCRPSEQNLDQTHIGFLFEQVGGKAVAQRVRRHSLLDRRPIGSGMNGAIELPRRQRQQRITARERETARSGWYRLVYGVRRPAVPCGVPCIWAGAMNAGAGLAAGAVWAGGWWVGAQGEARPAGRGPSNQARLSSW